MPNRLAQEKSPYLLQHKDNPVDWYPWGEEAFEKARREDKPIFLSIGYSTCHWCHVMERESFENEELAQVMNRLFVNVKVDREERPDVDRVYMTYVQATTGGGGWPMSVFLTPDLKPFFGGTYFPPDDRHGRPGFRRLLEALSDAWRNRRADVEKAGESVVDLLRQSASGEEGGAVERQALERGFQVFDQAFDERLGGFGAAPKFPRPCTFDFLLRYFARTGQERAVEMVHKTLRAMSLGGMYDQLAGGYHRYSVDRQWHVPHFEKMLYDQAQIVKSLLECWQITGDPLLQRAARQTCDYVLRDMTDPETGGFFSAEDADSLVSHDSHEKREGAFYVFSAGEIDEALGEDAGVFRTYYAVADDGNADDPHGELTGKNILHVTRSVEALAEEKGLDPAVVEAILDRGRKSLLAVRNRRPRPHLDDKVLTAWNGMMISALARAHQVLGEPRYLEAARRAARFATSRLFDAETGTLLRRYRDGEAAIEGYLEDYAFFVEGLLDLYEADLDGDWLTHAVALTEEQIRRFADETGGGFFSTSGRDASVLVRLKEDYDGAEPSGNSVAALNLHRLAVMVGRPEWRERAEKTVAAFARRLGQAPHTLPRMLVAFDFGLEPPAEVVLAGERDDERVFALLRAAHASFSPHKVVLLCDEAFRSRYGAALPAVRDMKPRDGKPVAYVCRDFRCDAPTSDPREIRAKLGVSPVAAD